MIRVNPFRRSKRPDAHATEHRRIEDRLEVIEHALHIKTKPEIGPGHVGPSLESRGLSG